MNLLDQELKAVGIELSSEAEQKLTRFYELLKEENKKQNLTRLIEPRDFIEGHVYDAWKLHHSGFLHSPSLDLGSGAGSPGLICALFNPQHQWVLTDSEKRKAAFLIQAQKQLQLENCQVFADRAERLLKSKPVPCITVRAVGTVSKIFALLSTCSTWNTLLLLKGPRWQEEWTEFQGGSFRSQLKIEAVQNYEVGIERKKRLLINLKRVPRGTKRE